MSVSRQDRINARSLRWEVPEASYGMWCFLYLEELKEEPLSIYVNNNIYGLLDYTKVLRNGIFAWLYSPPRQWYYASSNLAKLLQGNATDAFLMYGREEAFSRINEANQIVMYNDGKTGPAYWPQGRVDILDEIVPMANSSVFSMIDLSSFFGRQQ